MSFLLLKQGGHLLLKAGGALLLDIAAGLSGRKKIEKRNDLTLKKYKSDATEARELYEKIIEADRKGMVSPAVKKKIAKTVNPERKASRLPPVTKIDFDTLARSINAIQRLRWAHEQIMNEEEEFFILIA